MNRCLVELRLDENMSGEEGATALATMLETNTVLQCITLEGGLLRSKWSVGGCVHASLLLTAGHLGRQTCADNGIGVDGAKSIGRALQYNGTLQNLVLSCWFPYSVILLSMMPSVRRRVCAYAFRPKDNEVEDEGGEAIGIGLCKNRGLATLEMEGLLFVCSLLPSRFRDSHWTPRRVRNGRSCRDCPREGSRDMCDPEGAERGRYCSRI